MISCDDTAVCPYDDEQATYWCEGPTCVHPGVSQTVYVEGTVCCRCQEDAADRTVTIPNVEMSVLVNGGGR